MPGYMPFRNARDAGLAVCPGVGQDNSGSERRPGPPGRRPGNRSGGLAGRLGRLLAHSRSGRRTLIEPVMWAESLIGQIERFEALDSLGRTVTGAFSRVVRPGRVKDALSGTWMAHPAHPMLTDVTIGAWVSAVLLDALGGEQARTGADRLVGIGVLSALPTAVTGLSDLSDVEDRQVRRLGVAHALGNVLAAALYGSSYLARKSGRRPAGTALSVLGAAAVTGSGFLGGHLAYRRGIGVDHTAFHQPLHEWTAVLDDAELAEASPRRVAVAGTDVLLYRAQGRIFALANRCSHRGGPLHKGRVHDRAVTCPWHLSTFRLEDGAILQGPATAPQPAYEVRVVNGKIQVRTRG